MRSLPALRPAERGTAEGLATAPRLLAQFQALGPDRFFAGTADAALPALVARLAPEARDRTLALAESILLGRFDLLGRRGLFFGDPPDFRLDPRSGVRSPLVHWSLIDPTDAAAVGDCKLVWELGRQQFLVTLGIAYRSTGDERYAQAFARLVTAWLRTNPPGLGIHWASSLEVALRLVAWCWALVLFRKSPHLTPELFAEIFDGIGAHAAHVERYLSRHFSPNTHLTGEALGLFYAGVLFPEGRSAARWRARGQQILDEQVELQVLPDGVYFEQSTAYQRYTVEIYLHYLMLAARNGRPVSPEVGERVQGMLDVLLALRRPDGGMPAIGDADGGCLLPLVPREPDDLRGLFGTAAVFFGRADYAWAAETLPAEALWFLGSAAASAFTPGGTAPPRDSSRAFPSGGYVVMRSSWRRDAHQLIFDAGPLGCSVSGAHGHADLLSVQVCAFGEAYLVDPGTYTYADGPWRDHFRATRAHGTLRLDAQEQARPAGPFAWRQRPAARLCGFESTRDYELADARHDAYRSLPDPVVHRRRVAYVRSPGYWLIADELEGAEEHRFEVRFPFAPMPVSHTADGWVRAAGSHGRGLLVRAFASRALAARIECGSTSPIEGWVSPAYGRREPAPILIYEGAGSLPLRILTLLLPVEDVAAAAPRVAPVLDGDGPAGLAFVDTGHTARFSADAFTLEVPFAWTA